MPGRMPAEWAPHEATWIAWPHEESDWPGKFEPVQWVYGEFVRLVAGHERVRILVPSAEVRKQARKVLAKCGAPLAQVDFHTCPTDRSWTRDYCPIFVTGAEGERVATDWKFNGWAKYRNWKRDNAVPEFVARKLGVRREAVNAVLEGGAIDVNGGGLLLATKECLLDPEVQTRNPGMNQAALEELLRLHLGAEKVLWLERGIVGDDTHGHIDDVARFVDARTVVTVVEDRDPLDENWDITHENLETLRGMTTLNGRPLRIATLPMPGPVRFAGQRLPASYANFYICNGLVLVPTFNDPADRIALNTLARLFPDREVVGIYCGDLVLGLGTLHCMTQQEPAAT